jgi:hypothetical protein
VSNLPVGRRRHNGRSMGSPRNISGVLRPYYCCCCGLNLLQFYFYTVISGYGVGQRGDHEKFNSIYSMTGLNSDDAPLTNRQDPWDSRMDRGAGGGRGHTRQESTSSDSAMLNNSKDRSTEPVPQPTNFPSEQTSRGHGEYGDPYYRGADQSS